MVNETRVHYKKLIIIQIMNINEFNGAIIFIRWKIEHSFQRGKAKLNRIILNLSTNEINRIERMEKHLLFVSYKTLVELFSFDCRMN